MHQLSKEAPIPGMAQGSYDFPQKQQADTQADTSGSFGGSWAMDRLEDHGKRERLTGFVTNSEKAVCEYGSS